MWDKETWFESRGTWRYGGTRSGGASKWRWVSQQHPSMKLHLCNCMKHPVNIEVHLFNWMDFSASLDLPFWSKKFSKLHVLKFPTTSFWPSKSPTQTSAEYVVAKAHQSGPSSTPASARAPSNSSTRNASSSGSDTPKRSSASCATTDFHSRQVSNQSHLP